MVAGYEGFCGKGRKSWVVMECCHLVSVCGGCFNVHYSKGTLPMGKKSVGCGKASSLRVSATSAKSPPSPDIWQDLSDGVWFSKSPDTCCTHRITRIQTFKIWNQMRSGP